MLKAFQVHVQVCVKALDIWSLTLLLEGLDNPSLPDYEDKDVGFRICQHCKIILFSQINSTSNLDCTYVHLIEITCLNYY